MIRIRRVYEAPETNDGYRILVDRVWPRGISKEKAMVDLWLKPIAPSTDLRKWFGHDPGKWETFREKYKEELKDKEDYLKQIKEKKNEKGTVTLVFGAKDENHNNAVVLKEVLEERRH